MNILLWEKNTHEQPFHLVDVSPWPFTTSMSLATLLSGVALYFHSYTGGALILIYGVLSLVYSLAFWWRDVIREATYEGMHTEAVQAGLRIGMVVFILSEVFFFASFFWSYFHSSLSPTIELGNIWPPKGITLLNPLGLPFVNTIILLTSGATITWAHYAMTTEVYNNIFYFDETGTAVIVDEDAEPESLLKVWWKPLFIKKSVNIMLDKNYVSSANISSTDPVLTDSFDTEESALKYFGSYPHNHTEAQIALIHTIVLGLLFLIFQGYEYISAAFSIADGIYGTTFYMLTGFHGLHVLVGTIFLIVCAYRNQQYHFTMEHHVGFEAAIWYWHFVDVVWLFLFISIYWWGGQ